MQDSSSDAVAETPPEPATGPGLWAKAEQSATTSPDGAEDTVIAVLVTHNGARWLPRALAAIAASVRRPDRVIAVDTGSADGSAALLRQSAAVDEVITLPSTAGFAAAVAAAVGSGAAPDQPGDTAPGRPPNWLWLLHDDCAAEPETLGLLLAKAHQAPAAVVGPKARGWHDEGLLVECGATVTNSGRRYTGLQAGDRDQGQRDDVGDVLAVGSAGMLVRQDVWDRLGGFDPNLPLFGDDVEFCMRVRRSGERVVVAPAAVVHHREAATHGVRSTLLGREPSLAARSAALYTTLVHGPVWSLPVTSVLLLLRSLLAAVLLLFSDGPRRAAAELRVWGSMHLHPMRVLRARRRVRDVATVGRRTLRPLRPRFGEQVAAAVERTAVAATASFRERRGAPVGLAAGLVVAAVLALVAAAATREVWMGAGQLAGGALLPPVDGTALWTGFRTAWHDVGLGSAQPAAFYPLALVVAASPPVVSVAFVVQGLLLFTPALAALTAYLALRGLPRRLPRIGLAVAYGLTPAAVAPSLDGRLGTAAVAVLLPWLARLLVRIYAVPTEGVATGAGPTDAGILPPARVRTVAAATLLLAVAAAFAPLVWVAAAVCVLVALAVSGRTARAWAWSAFLLLVPVALLWPWSGALIADPSRLMFEAGVSSPQLAAAEPPSWRLLLLDPGTMGDAILPLAAGLVVAAAVSLIPGRSRGTAVWGWLVVAVGFIGATVQTSQKFVPVGATTAQFGFAGPMLHIMAVGMVIAAAGLAVASGPARRAAGRAASVLAMAGLVAGPAVLAGLWIIGLDGQLTRDDESAVPAFVAEEAVSPAAVRTLLLQADGDEGVRYTLVNGAGGRLGDADVAPPAESWRALSVAVAEVAAGVGPAPVGDLARNAVQYIVADTSSGPLTAALDGNSALRRLSTTDGRGLWVIDEPAARARVVSEAPPVLVGVQPASGSPLLQDEITTGAGGGQLQIAQHDDGAWLISLNGAPAAPVGGDLVAIDLPADTAATVAVGRDQGRRDMALLIPLGAALLVGVLLLPRGGLGLPPDPDAGDDPQVPAGPERLVDLTEGGSGAAARALHAAPGAVAAGGSL